MPRRTKAQEQEKQEAISRLREEMPLGTTVYTILRHVSRSGMSRSISVHTIGDYGGRPYFHDWTWLVSRAMELPIDQRNNGVKVGGCGMDMGFHLVMNLSYVIHGTQNQPNYDPDAPSWENNRNHSTAGYTLDHKWV